MALAKTGSKRNSRRDNPDEFRATLGEHLEELRVRVMRSVGVLAAGCAVGWFLAMPVYRALSHVVQANIPKGVNYQEPFTSITQPFMLQLKLAFYISLTLTLPYIVWELWGFVAPGLRPNEKRPLRAFAPVSLVLFLFGCWLGWMSLPAAFQWFAGFFASFPGTSLYQEPGTMVFLIVKLVLAFGVGFQLPVVTFFLTKAGVLSPQTVSQYWRQAILAIIVLCAILTPSGDPFTLAAMAVPLSVLFIGSIFAARLTGKAAQRDPALDDLD